MFLKTWFGHCIYESAEIKVFQNYFYRWLTFHSEAIQTLISRTHPEIPALEYVAALILPVLQNPESCCLLGLGGAGVVHALNRHLGQTKIIAVEKSQEVIEVAQQFFMTEQLSQLEIIHDDALQFVKHSTQKFHHILIDLYNENSFPADCVSELFFNHCKQLLCEEGGFIAVNLANKHEQWQIFQHIRNCFSGITLAIPVKNTANIIILAHNSPSRKALFDIANQAAIVKKISWDQKWGCIAHLY